MLLTLVAGKFNIYDTSCGVTHLLRFNIFQFWLSYFKHFIRKELQTKPGVGTVGLPFAMPCIGQNFTSAFSAYFYSVYTLPL